MRFRFAIVAACALAACKSSSSDAPPNSVDASTDAFACTPVRSSFETKDVDGIFPGIVGAVSGNGKVLLTWAAPASGALRFNVYRGTKAGGEDPTPIAQDIASVSYLDTSVTNGTRYYYSWVDMTSQQAQNALFSGFIATNLEEDAVASFFLEEYLALGGLLLDRFWDPSIEMFCDIQSTGSSTGVKTALAFWPLLPHVASFDQTRSLVAHLQNPDEFWRPNVIPVLAKDQVGYTPAGEYWNGAVWAPTNYMALQGLHEYGTRTSRARSPASISGTWRPCSRRPAPSSSTTRPRARRARVCGTSSDGAVSVPSRS